MEDNKDFVEKVYREEFLPKAHLVGIITCLLAVVLCLLPPLYLSFVRSYHPGWAKVLAGFVLIASTAGVYWFVEPISYFPILGISGTYMSFLAGNIANQRLPCAAAAQNAVKAEPGSKKAEMAGILGIAASIVINILTLTLLVIAGAIIVANLPPSVTASFKYVLAGVFGAMFVQFATKGPIYALFALPLGIALNYVTPLPPWGRIPIAVFASIFIGISYYRRTSGKVNTKENASGNISQSK